MLSMQLYFSYQIDRLTQILSDFLLFTPTSLPFGDTPVVPYVLLANLPQVIISFVYLTYNGLFTCMLANREWAQYAVKRASLRVTNPSPTQRSTYGIPLMTASIVLHWFISQSIFLARIHIYPVNDVNDEQMISDLGYSESALIASIAWGIFLVTVCLLVAGLCTYPNIGMPVGGSNSAVISAACHLKYGEEEEHRNKEHVTDARLKWGVTIAGSRTEVGHCCFSDGMVEKPEEGCLYAGARS
jgi:hypothetical protein